jgi:hypothetical protein
MICFVLMSLLMHDMPLVDGRMLCDECELMHEMKCMVNICNECGPTYIGLQDGYVECVMVSFWWEGPNGAGT